MSKLSSSSSGNSNNSSITTIKLLIAFVLIQVFCCSHCNFAEAVTVKADCSGKPSDGPNQCLQSLASAANPGSCDTMKTALKCIIPCGAAKAWKSQFLRSFDEFRFKCPSKSRESEGLFDIVAVKDVPGNNIGGKAGGEKDIDFIIPQKGKIVEQKVNAHHNSMDTNGKKNDKINDKPSKKTKPNKGDEDDYEETEVDDPLRSKITVRPARVYKPTGDPDMFGSANQMSANQALLLGIVIPALFITI